MTTTMDHPVTIKSLCDELDEALTAYAEHGERLRKRAGRALLKADQPVDDVDCRNVVPALSMHVCAIGDGYEALALRIEEENDAGADVLAPNGLPVVPDSVRLEGSVAVLMSSEWALARAAHWRELGEHHVALLGLCDDGDTEPGT